MYQLDEILVLGFLVAIPAAGFSVVGVLLLYSAVTGKGLEKPGPEAMLEIRVWYAIRGFVGLGFLAGSVLMIVMLLCNW